MSREVNRFIGNLLRAQNALPRVIAAHAIPEEALCLRDGAILVPQKRRIGMRFGKNSFASTKPLFRKSLLFPVEAERLLAD